MTSCNVAGGFRVELRQLGRKSMPIGKRTSVEGKHLRKNGGLRTFWTLSWLTPYTIFTPLGGVLVGEGYSGGYVVACW